MLGALPLFALAATAIAGPYKRDDGLTVKVNTPGDNVKSVDGLKFTAEVTNNGSEDVKVFRYGTILDKLPTSSFKVAKDGKDIAFKGARVNVDHKNEGAYTTIKAGETVKVEHDLAALYDFSSSGTGKFDFTPNTNFNVAGSSKGSKIAKTQVQADTISVNITDDVNKRDIAMKKRTNVTRRTLDKRATVQCDDSTKSDFISSSYDEGKELATLGSKYVSDNAEDTLVTDYFGGNSASDITGVLDAVADEDDSSRTLNCSDEADACEQGVIAYTIIATTDIYYCDIFYDEVETTELCSGTTVEDRNIRGGTTLHEITHAVADTVDQGYGCEENQELSDSEMISNADNFNCFVTQVYADNSC